MLREPRAAAVARTRATEHHDKIATDTIGTMSGARIAEHVTRTRAMTRKIVRLDGPLFQVRGDSTRLSRGAGTRRGAQPTFPRTGFLDAKIAQSGLIPTESSVRGR